jgi:hypothetical protein
MRKPMMRLPNARLTLPLAMTALVLALSSAAPGQILTIASDTVWDESSIPLPCSIPQSRPECEIPEGLEIRVLSGATLTFALELASDRPTAVLHNRGVITIEGRMNVRDLILSNEGGLLGIAPDGLLAIQRVEKQQSSVENRESGSIVNEGNVIALPGGFIRNDEGSFENDGILDLIWGFSNRSIFLNRGFVFLKISSSSRNSGYLQNSGQINLRDEAEFENVGDRWKIIKKKVGLLNLAEELGNVSRACKVMGYSRDTFYRLQKKRCASNPAQRRG